MSSAASASTVAPVQQLLQNLATSSDPDLHFIALSDLLASVKNQNIVQLLDAKQTRQVLQLLTSHQADIVQMTIKCIPFMDIPTVISILDEMHSMANEEIIIMSYQTLIKSKPPCQLSWLTRFISWNNHELIIQYITTYAYFLRSHFDPNLLNYAYAIPNYPLLKALSHCIPNNQIESLINYTLSLKSNSQIQSRPFYSVIHAILSRNIKYHTHFSSILSLNISNIDSHDILDICQLLQLHLILVSLDPISHTTLAPFINYYSDQDMDSNDDFGFDSFDNQSSDDQSWRLRLDALQLIIAHVNYYPNSLVNDVHLLILSKCSDSDPHVIQCAIHYYTTTTVPTHLIPQLLSSLHTLLTSAHPTELKDDVVLLLVKLLQSPESDVSPFTTIPISSHTLPLHVALLPNINSIPYHLQLLQYLIKHPTPHSTILPHFRQSTTISNYNYTFVNPLPLPTEIVPLLQQLLINVDPMIIATWYCDVCSPTTSDYTSILYLNHCNIQTELSHLESKLSNTNEPSMLNQIISNIGHIMSHHHMQCPCPLINLIFLKLPYLSELQPFYDLLLVQPQLMIPMDLLPLFVTTNPTFIHILTTHISELPIIPNIGCQLLCDQLELILFYCHLHLGHNTTPTGRIHTWGDLIAQSLSGVKVPLQQIHHIVPNNQNMVYLGHLIDDYSVYMSDASISNDVKIGIIRGFVDSNQSVDSKVMVLLNAMVTSENVLEIAHIVCKLDVVDVHPLIRMGMMYARLIKVDSDWVMGYTGDALDVNYYKLLLIQATAETKEYITAQCHVNMKHVRILDMGLMKIKIDDGLVNRKMAYGKYGALINKGIVSVEETVGILKQGLVDIEEARGSAVELLLNIGVEGIRRDIEEYREVVVVFVGQVGNPPKLAKLMQDREKTFDYLKIATRVFKGLLGLEEEIPEIGVCKMKMRELESGEYAQAYGG